MGLVPKSCEYSGALCLAFISSDFELVFIIVSVALVVKHADQQVLLVYIPDVNPMAQRFVGHMCIVAFSYFTVICLLQFLVGMRQVVAGLFIRFVSLLSKPLWRFMTEVFMLGGSLIGLCWSCRRHREQAPPTGELFAVSNVGGGLPRDDGRERRTQNRQAKKSPAFSEALV